jgi:hypothetical protein
MIVEVNTDEETSVSYDKLIATLKSSEKWTGDTVAIG